MAVAQTILCEEFPLPFQYNPEWIKAKHIHLYELTAYYNRAENKKLKQPDEHYLIEFDTTGTAVRYFYFKRNKRVCDTVSLKAPTCASVQNNNYQTIVCDSIGRISEIRDNSGGYSRYFYSAEQCIRVEKLVTAVEGASTLFIEKNEYNANESIAHSRHQRFQVDFKGTIIKDEGCSDDYYVYDPEDRLVRIGDSKECAEITDVLYCYASDGSLEISRYSLCIRGYEILLTGKIKS